MLEEIMYKFKFADIGEGLHEGMVGEIYVKINDKINEGDSLFSVETDKVTSDIPSPVTGRIFQILIKTGEKIYVGDEIFYINENSQEQIDNVMTEKKIEKVTATKTKNESGASVVSSIKISDQKMTTFETNKQNTPILKKVFATPYARRLASENNIDISKVLGTGNNDRVLAKDIENFLVFKLSPITLSSPKFKTSSLMLKPFIKPVTAMRKAIAKAMTNSWNNVAYTNLSVEVNMTKLWEERKSLITYTEKKYGIKISFTALIALATVKILYDFQIFNCKYVESENVIKHDGTINLGIAVDTPKGLVVPVIKNAHTKNIIEITQNIIDLAGKARTGKLTKGDISEGTFTLTNYGSMGAMFGVPIINYPELAILGIGTITDRVFQNEKRNFYNGKVIYLTAAADHRWIDGADIGRFLIQIKELLEKPILLLSDI